MKLKLPHFPRLVGHKKKLRAATARRATGAGADFDDMSEPNMKLSRALLIVLVLHVVAVAGIIAFNAIKSRQAGTPTALAQASKSQVVGLAHHEEAKSAHFATAKSERKSKLSDSPPLPEGAKYYTVAKGDNPVNIAKKFKVPYDDLLAANHIDDPRKLRVGQKLIIPAKAAKTKKTE